MAKKYLLEMKDDNRVLISEHLGYKTWENTPAFEYLEVSRDFSHETLKPEKRHGKARWNFNRMNSPTDVSAWWTGRPEDYISLPAINAAKRLWMKNWHGIPARLAEARKHPAWKLMDEVADDFIQHYRADFYYWDTLYLKKYAPEKFLWFVRPTGTWLVAAKSDWARSTVKYCTENEPHRIFVYRNMDGIPTLTSETKELVWDVYCSLPAVEEKKELAKA